MPRQEERPTGFYEVDFDVSAWKEIPVPCNMEIQGYGTPFYRNFGYTFQKDWPHVTSPPKEYTAYRNAILLAATGATLKCPLDGMTAKFL